MGNRCPKCGRSNLAGATVCVKCEAPLGPFKVKDSVLFPGRGLSRQTSLHKGSLQTGRRSGGSYRTGFLPPSYLLAERYRIINRLGKGGMGAVYLAADTHLGDRFVAVKEMSQSRLPRLEIPQAIENFSHEALLLATLSHPNLPHIYDYFSDRGRKYLVMEYIDGETLEAYLHQMKERRLSIDEVLDIGMQLCTVLHYLHTRRPPIIFRDLKPGNVIRKSTGDVYLIDFGIARHFKPGQLLDTAKFGTQGYAAPELSRQQTSARSDIYSLGALLHQLLTGDNPTQKPFSFTPLRQHNPAIPVELEKLIMHMLDMEPDNRPVSMTIIKQDLEDIQESMVLRAESVRSSNPGRLRQMFRQLPFVHSMDDEPEGIGSLSIEEGIGRGNRYELSSEYTRLGRNRDNDIYFDDTLISRYHASITYLEHGDYALRDEGSANGTTINGQPVESNVLYTLKDGDKIQLGQTVLVFHRA